MTINKHAVLVLVCFGLAILVSPLSTGEAKAQTTTLDEVKQRGVLRAGVRQDVPGFGSVDEKGQTVGFDVDVATELAKRLGVKIELVPVAAATRIPLLQQGRIDLIAATLTHYRERDKVIDFSIGYFWTGQKLMVKKDSNIKSLADLAGNTAVTAFYLVLCLSIAALGHVLLRLFSRHRRVLA